MARISRASGASPSPRARGDGLLEAPHDRIDVVLGLEHDFRVGLGRFLGEALLDDEGKADVLVFVDAAAMDKAVQPRLEGDGAHRRGEDKAEKAETIVVEAVVPALHVAHRVFHVDVLGEIDGRLVPSPHQIGHDGAVLGQVLASPRIGSISKEHKGLYRGAMEAVKLHSSDLPGLDGAAGRV